MRNYILGFINNNFTLGPNYQPRKTFLQGLRGWGGLLFYAKIPRIKIRGVLA